jgi:uncharacterized repeat protein (TIGR01451 family)
MNLGGDYGLTYHATADNAYFVFNDATGFSNKTGMKRIDWEQEGLLKGKNIDVTNNLFGAFKPRAGAEDWLPCTCLSGLIPPIEPIDSKLDLWPSQEAKLVLQPPDLKLEKECPNGNCGAFLYLNPSSGAGTGLLTYKNLQNLPQVQVESNYKKVADGIVKFTINVRNLGSVDVANVVLVHELSSGTSYVSGSATMDHMPQEPINSNGSLAWKVGDLKAVPGPEGVKTIVFQVNVDNNSDPGQSTAYATYRIGSELKNTTLVNSQTEPIHTPD